MQQIFIMQEYPLVSESKCVEFVIVFLSALGPALTRVDLTKQNLSIYGRNAVTNSPFRRL